MSNKILLALAAMLFMALPSRAQTHSVTISCVASISPGAIGYNFYRWQSGTATKVNSGVIAGCGYVDSKVDAGATYSYYTARSVDINGLESGDSNMTVSATIPGGTPPPPPPPSGDATCGFAAVGISTDNGDSNFITAQRCQANSTGGTSTSVSAYIKSAVSAGAVFQGAIYADNNGNPGALLGASASVSLLSNAWNTVALPGIKIAPNAFYWVAYNSNGTPAQNNMAFSPGGGTRKWLARNFGSWPNTWTASGTDSSRSSIYFTYNSATPPPPPPPPTLTVDCTKVKDSFSFSNMPVGASLVVTGTAGGKTAGCTIPLP